MMLAHLVPATARILEGSTCSHALDPPLAHVILCSVWTPTLMEFSTSDVMQSSVPTLPWIYK